MKQVAVDIAFKNAFKGQSAVKGEESFQGKHWAWPSTDPGKWSPESLLILYHESGLPEQATYPQTFPMWRKLEEELRGVFGFPVYIENINAAVSAVWRG